VLVGAGTLAGGLALIPTAHAKAPSVDWDGLRKDVVAIMDAEEARRGDGTGGCVGMCTVTDSRTGS